jgi:sec-independent protein translocase protein TatC
MADLEAAGDGALSARPDMPVPASEAPASAPEAPASAPETPAPAAPSPGPEAPAAAPGEMSLVGHLTELRNRVVKSILAIALGAAIGFIFWTDIRDVLLQPLPPGPDGGLSQVQVLAPGDAFAIALRIALVSGIILAMPVILYQLWAFVAPGLTAAERRIVRPWIPLALLFFALGVGVAYLVLPATVGFLLGFTDDRLVGNLAAGPYFDFVTTIFLAFGIVLEFPIVLFGLSRVGIVTSERLAKARGIALIGIFLFAALITPSTDPISMVVLGGTMYLLFEGTIFFIRRSGK